MKKIIIAILCCTLLFFSGTTINAENDGKNGAETNDLVEYMGEIPAGSALLMEAESGRVLVSHNADRALEPASVTKIMTLLLVMEAIDSGALSPQDEVTVSANAASMGGSQVFLKEGEILSVEELLKCTVIASANDAAVALAERVAGSESAFVRQMNARAMELGMRNTCFENTTGLDDTTVAHKTSAYDIALMSRELIKHELILKYSSMWQDTIRDGAFTLTNTNRLVRFYDGCTGLKTGSTSSAGFCMSATAKRDGMHLIAVVMGADTRDSRNQLARELLDFGFANYCMFSQPERVLEPVAVHYGAKNEAMLYAPGFTCIIRRDQIGKVEAAYDIPQNITAPIECGDAVGRITYTCGDTVIGEEAIIISEKIEKLGFLDIFQRVILSIFYKLW